MSTQFDYTKYDYNALTQEITRLVSEKDSWKDAYQSSTGQVLIQLVAAMTDQLNYMLERRTQENFLPTAKLPTAVNAIAGLLGFRADRKVSSFGKLSLTLVDSNGSQIQNVDDILIPKYSALSFDNKSFVNKEPISLTSNPHQIYPYNIDIIEGTVKTLTFDTTDTTSTLYNNNYIDIPDYIDIENTSFWITTPTQEFVDVRVRVGNKPPIDSLGFASSTDIVYDINTTNNGLRLVFGDGVNGQKPVGVVTVKYIISSGDTVEVLTTNNDFVFDSFSQGLVDQSSNVYQYILKNTTNIIGGKKAFTIDDIKIKAPQWTSTSNRAVTESDFVYWVNRSNIGSVIDSSVVGENELGITTVNANNIFVTYLTNSGDKLTTSELSDLDNYLSHYKMTTTQILYEKAEVIPLQLNIRIKRDSVLSASDSEVYDSIMSQLDQAFAFGEGSLDRDVFHSDLVNKFYDATITKGGKSFSIGSYVNIDIKSLKPFESPWIASENIDVTFSYVDGNTYTLTINDIDYTYVATASDTPTTIGKEFKKILDLSNSVVATENIGVINISRNPNNLENNLRYSNDFSNTVWNTIGTVIKTKNNISPDGFVNEATTLNDTSVSVTSYIEQSITIVPSFKTRTLSFYIKKDNNTTRFPAIEMIYSGITPITSTVKINTSTGATSTLNTIPTTLSVEDYIDYWRVNISLADTLSNTLLTYKIYPAYSDTLNGVSTPSVIGGFVGFGIQDSQRALQSNYLNTLSTPLNVPFEDTPVENRVRFSEDLSNSVWFKTSDTTVVYNNAVDSLGNLSLDKVTVTGSGTGTQSINQQITNIQSGERYQLTFDVVEESTSLPFTFGVHDTTNNVWITDFISVIPTSVPTQSSVIFDVPPTCNTISVYPFMISKTQSGSVNIGRLKVAKSSSSMTYTPTTYHQNYIFDDSFTLTNDKSTVVSDVLILTDINIPVPSLVPSTENQIKPSFVDIVDDSGTVVYTDNYVGGTTGTINTTPQGTIDYTSGKMTIPLLSNGKYNVRFVQNIDENFLCNKKQVFGLLRPKDKFTDTTNTLSTVDFI